MNFDQNHERVAFGYAPGYYGEIIETNFTIDIDNMGVPRLLIEIIPVPGDPDTLPSMGQQDANFEYSGLAQTNDSNETVVPIIIETVTKGLYCDVFIEP